MARPREEVAEALADALSDRNKGLVFDDENLTVGEYLDRWLSDCVRGSVRLAQCRKSQTNQRSRGRTHRRSGQVVRSYAGRTRRAPLECS